MERLKAGRGSLSKAVNIIRSGGVVIFPTETVYGLGAAIKSKEGIKRIFKIKQRKLTKLLQVLISNKSQLKELVSEIPPVAIELIKKHWPGPLTIIFNKKRGGTIGVRMPGHKVPLAIIKKCGPIAATSANISGEKAPCSADEVKIEADLLLDGGYCKFKEASTVIDVTVSPPKVLRQGKIRA